MNGTEKRFLQVILLLLALLFTFTVRYLSERETAEVSTASRIPRDRYTITGVFNSILDRETFKC